MDLVKELGIICPENAWLHNYIVPGLYSQLLAMTPDGGKVRMFHMTRHQEVAIVPHSHRYSLKCFVREGVVHHTTFNIEDVASPMLATHALVQYSHAARGLRKDVEPAFVRARRITNTYGPEMEYQLAARDVHTLKFQRGTKVLIIEGPQEHEFNECMLPVEQGKVLDTFFHRDWMMTQPTPNEHAD